MRIFHLHSNGVTELHALPTEAPAQGFFWIACSRPDLEAQLAEVQGALQRLAGVQLVDLHVSDLLSTQLPSRYDYTSQYDLLVFRRLASATAPVTVPGGAPNGVSSVTCATSARAGNAPAPGGAPDAPAPAAPRKHRGPPVLRRIDTSPVGFALFDPVLLSVHPPDCTVRDAYAARLLAAASGQSPEGRTGARLPGSPVDLMLRLMNLIVDGYLDLRRELTRQLDHWQVELLKPRTRFTNWGALLDARLSLHQLDEVCEDQRNATQDWIDALASWATPDDPAGQREHDLLQVRSRDVLEHIERVLRHVHRLEQSVETAVQLHFSLQGNRTNDIMRTLTTLTAVFLPLNLIAAIFGMNFEFIPLVHRQNGFWWAMATMAVISFVLLVFFWRRRYLARGDGQK